jgi:hypothetical protein
MQLLCVVNRISVRSCGSSIPCRNIFFFFLEITHMIPKTGSTAGPSFPLPPLGVAALAGALAANPRRRYLKGVIHAGRKVLFTELTFVAPPTRSSSSSSATQQQTLYMWEEFDVITDEVLFRKTSRRLPPGWGAAPSGPTSGAAAASSGAGPAARQLYVSASTPGTAADWVVEVDLMGGTSGAAGVGAGGAGGGLAAGFHPERDLMAAAVGAPVWTRKDTTDAIQFRIRNVPYTADTFQVSLEFSLDSVVGDAVAAAAQTVGSSSSGLPMLPPEASVAPRAAGAILGDTIVVRTTNKKFFKRLQIPELARFASAATLAPFLAYVKGDPKTSIGASDILALAQTYFVARDGPLAVTWEFNAPSTLVITVPKPAFLRVGEADERKRRAAFAWERRADPNATTTASDAAGGCPQQ